MGDEDTERFERVSEGLKQAFQALATADVPNEEKPRWHERLIAITNSSKHDLGTAEKRLAQFWEELPRGGSGGGGAPPED